MHNLLGGIFVIALLIPVGLGLFANGVTADKVCGSNGSSHQQIFYNNPPTSFDGSNTWDSISWTAANATQGQYNDGEFTGKTVTKVQFWLMATNTTAYPSGGHIDGLVHAYVFDPNGNIAYDFGTVDASNLTPNDNTGNPASLPVSLVTFTGSHTMLANETIGYRYQGGSSTSYFINNFANYGAPASQSFILDYATGSGAWTDNIISNHPTFKLSGIFYETVGGNGHNPHCVEALNIALLTPLIAVGGIIVLLIKRYNDN